MSLPRLQSCAVACKDLLWQSPTLFSAPPLYWLLVQVWRQVFEQVIVSMLIFQLLMIGLCSLKSAPIQVSVGSSTHGVYQQGDSGGGGLPASAPEMCSVARQASPQPAILPTPHSVAALSSLCSHRFLPVRCAGWTAGASALSDSAVPAGSRQHF